MAKPKAKDKRQTQSQTTRQYKTSSEKEVVPDTWEKHTDIEYEQQPTVMKTNNTQQETVNTDTPPPQRLRTHQKAWIEEPIVHVTAALEGNQAAHKKQDSQPNYQNQQGK
ncbi:hypothetical protein DSO57_1012068 [Entomophthora muscae]|uniref:Uncharacterized protein n=1 Tax=Entomophthora muscae TaxID=34485 RepID=A0ACC2RXB2_9FUNG|nr:hypothetical protein DSO57_1012068 [Entomophthora muscae]